MGVKRAQPDGPLKVRISQSTISAVLNGARSFTEQHMITLAKFFNVGHGIILSGGRGERREVRHG
jgi:hypothetical protein